VIALSADGTTLDLSSAMSRHPFAVAGGWNRRFDAELSTPSPRKRATMGTVLNDGSVDQLKCLERAAECHRKAATAISPAARSKFLDAARQWLSLADSYALSDQSASSTFTPLKRGDVKDTLAAG
jgi:hypothetical protein